MKLINVIVFLFSIPFCENHNPEKGLVLNVVFRGNYDLPWRESLKERNEGDKEMNYFLIEVTIKNESDLERKFPSYLCTPMAFIVLDTKMAEVCVNNCNRNSLITIALQPGQEIHFPLLIQVKRENLGVELKMGWILIENINRNLEKHLEHCRKTFENVLWSNPIRMEMGNGMPLIIN